MRKQARDLLPGDEVLNEDGTTDWVVTGFPQPSENAYLSSIVRMPGRAPGGTPGWKVTRAGAEVEVRG